MNILEKEIEDIVFNTASDKLRARGLFIPNLKIRQLNLGSYGISDIIAYAFYRDEFNKVQIYITVIELKKDSVDANTVMQAARYCKGIDELLHREFNLDNHHLHFDIVVIGKTIQLNGDFVYMAEYLNNLRAYTYSIDLEKGITFTRISDYGIVNPTIVPLEKSIKGFVKKSIKNYYNG